ncbi:hypothetical protein BJ875DRAFT_388200 [Amylocarpus encephaloides]|uniref:Amidohydrolase-related domain-containing protein n=1 Tax=Amylocarpus encephaloides TaxID=45428 RepID=A0A9P7Y938_9HELO|nr:hypothetical protein BJ875DRAFT_388200 [Amylocarpus encephaloides]
MASSKPYPIIDSHIHLYPSSELSTLAWCTPASPLSKQHSIAEYATATGRPSNLEGFIFLETDRKSHLDGPEGWDLPLVEVDWLRRIATDQPKEGEGHEVGNGKLCLGIVPWAPVPAGEEAMEKYVKAVEERAGAAWGKVKGFRYLVQDKAKGTMLEGKFIQSLRWMGRRGFVFDLGVDQHSGGKWQLEEACEMVNRAHEGVKEGERVTIVINHLCKPDLSVYNETDPSFIAWRNAMFRLGKNSKTYMKLSGCFSEMPDSVKNGSILEIFIALQPYLAVILGAFGSFRVMFGSDWPVCTVGVEGADGAWKKWKAVVEKFCYLASLSDEDQIMIWSGTAIKAYAIEELM